MYVYILKNKLKSKQMKNNCQVLLEQGKKIKQL